MKYQYFPTIDLCFFLYLAFHSVNKFITYFIIYTLITQPSHIYECCSSRKVVLAHIKQPPKAAKTMYGRPIYVYLIDLSLYGHT